MASTNSFEETSGDEAESNTDNPFGYLPPEMLAEIFGKMDEKGRQQLRKVCRFWRDAIDHFHGIHLNITNLNWSWVENCSYAKTAKLCEFTRDVLNPTMVTSRLTKPEITNFIAYYSLMPLLEECKMLESLIINCVSFRPKSKLPEYTSLEYLDRKEKSNWLPRLKTFKFVSVTTQTGVYSHVTPSDLPEDIFGLEESVRNFDLSRGEMEFVPVILRILTHSKSLAQLDMVLTDIWKIPFGDLLQVAVDVPHPLASDLSLWHFGSKRLLPVAPILHKVSSLSTMRFSFTHHLDHFYMKFKPLTVQEASAPWQLEEVVVQHSLRWSQEMRDVDIPWLQILENQCYLRKIEYPFPITGDDQRMARIIVQNCKTLESVSFIGHRDNRAQDAEWLVAGQRGRLAWDSEWFSECDKLQKLHLKCHTRFLGPTSITALIKPNLLPHSLTHLTFHGCIDTGKNSLCIALCSLTNLQCFFHQARLCPWFVVDEMQISELQIANVKDVLLSMPHLKTWRLEWCDSSSAIVTHFVVNPDVQRQSACISNEVFDWIAGMKESIEFQDTTLDRQMKGMTITVVSHDKIFQVNDILSETKIVI